MQLNNSTVPDKIIELNTDYNNFVDEKWEDILRKSVENPKLRFEIGKSEKDLFLKSFNNFSNRSAIENSFHKKAEKHYSLTVEESFFLFFYTTNGSNHINDSLRNHGYDSAPSYIKTYTKLLNAVLEKLPSFDEQPVIHQSCHNLNNILREQWMTGHNTIIMPYFISSHKGEKWGDRSEYYIEILTNKTSKGKDITLIKEKEQEVLFMSNTQFEILEVDNKAKKIRFKEL